MFLCEIFGSARENHGNLSIQDLQAKVDGAQILAEEDVAKLADFENSVVLFMGAGDVHKYQEAYERYLKKNIKPYKVIENWKAV